MHSRLYIGRCNPNHTNLILRDLPIIIDNELFAGKIVEIDNVLRFNLQRSHLLITLK